MQFAELQLSLLSAHPDNPRKTFDEVGLQELADSIKEKGVLQPILVRPLDGAYQVVCGERRFRATTLAGFETIPVTIRDLSDEEALEAMLLENFQRQDVHPIEEAMGFAALRRMNGMTPLQIASKVGKSHQYVTSRLKLSSLVTELHEPFYAGKFNLKMALELSAFAPEVQLEWLGEQDADDDDWMGYREDVGISPKPLLNAPFDTTDEQLIVGTGSCGGCQHNSSTSLLFPEMDGRSMCLNPVCYKLKISVSAVRAIDEAVANGIPVIRTYQAIDALNEAFKRAGAVMNHNCSFEEPPVRSEVFEDGETFDTNIFDSLEDFNEYIEERTADWDRAVEDYETARVSTAYTDAIYIDGDGCVKQVRMRIKSEQPAPASKVDLKTIEARIKSGEATLLERDAAVQSLNKEREAAKEASAREIYDAAKELFKDRVIEDADGFEEDYPNDIFFDESELSDVEIDAAIFVMLKDLDNDAPYFVERMLGHAMGSFTKWCDQSDMDEMSTDAIYSYAMEYLKIKERVPLKSFDKFQRMYTRLNIHANAGPSYGRVGLGMALFVQVAEYHFTDAMAEVNNQAADKLRTKLTNLDTKISLINKGL